MRYKEIISEIEIGGAVDSSYLSHISTTHQPPEGFRNKQYDLFSDIPTLEPNLPKNMKKLGNIGKLIVVELKEKNNNETTTLVLFDIDKPIGWIALGQIKRGYEINFAWGAGENAKGLQVHSVYLDTSHRGQNLSIELYKWILTHVCDYLVADELQTFGGVKIWRRALNSKKFDVMVFDAERQISRRRWAGKDFAHVYNTFYLIPWMTLKGKADKLMNY